MFPVALAGRDAFESVVVGVVPPLRWPDEVRSSCWWLALFSGALAGRKVTESLVVGVVLVALAG
ncbi:MAG: hypothetical protein H7839_22495 [Magnetococcus sp. YQC-5]